MSSTADNSKQNTDAMLKEARAVTRAAKAYGTLNRSSQQTPAGTTRNVSRDIVISFLGGKRV